jgi:hypothetical protein
MVKGEMEMLIWGLMCVRWHWGGMGIVVMVVIMRVHLLDGIICRYRIAMGDD